MIAAIRGVLCSKLGDRVVVATPGGVSYELSVPLGVFERLVGEGGEIELQTVLVIREDGWALYGFDTPEERSVFQRLLSATGVGPRLALAVLSALGGARVVRALREGDVGLLCTVSGIGKKTAERMVVELKDKVGDLMTREPATPAAAPADQAVQALVSLGYAPAEADRAVRAALSSNGGAPAVDLIRGALARLSSAR